MSTTKKQLLEAVAAVKHGRSAWTRGVKAYAVELVEGLDDGADLSNELMLQKALLNGASSWAQYSEGGAALCYDADIAERLCSPSELKRNKWGMRDPNRRENWLEVQASALWQAHRVIETEWRKLERGRNETARLFTFIAGGGPCIWQPSLHNPLSRQTTSPDGEGWALNADSRRVSRASGDVLFRNAGGSVGG